MKNYQKLATAAVVTLMVASPLIASANMGLHLGLKADSDERNERAEVKSENHFMIPWGIWKKLGFHASTTASTTVKVERESFLRSLRNFFKNLVTGTYNLSITATDQNGHATSTVLGSFTK